MPDEQFRKGERVFVVLPADPPIRYVPFRDAVNVIRRGGSIIPGYGVLTVESIKGGRRYKVLEKFCSHNPI